MSNEVKASPITDLLRRTILEAVEGQRTSYLALERETGMSRGSVMRFVRGSQSLRLDLADRLADYFGLELRRKRKR